MIALDFINIDSCAGRPFFRDITTEVCDAIARAGAVSGICVAYTHHTTCSVCILRCSVDTTYGDVEFLQQDLVDVFDRLLPVCRREGQYLHPGPKATVFAAEHGEDKPAALNTDGHLRSSILRRSAVIPVRDGAPDLFRGRIYFVDFDQTRGRCRAISICVLGE